MLICIPTYLYIGHTDGPETTRRYNQLLLLSQYYIMIEMGFIAMKMKIEQIKYYSGRGGTPGEIGVHITPSWTSTT